MYISFTQPLPRLALAFNNTKKACNRMLNSSIYQLLEGAPLSRLATFHQIPC